MEKVKQKITILTQKLKNLFQSKPTLVQVLMQNFEGISERFINNIKTIEDAPCYLSLNNSPFLVIALHQHLGLVEGFSDMVSDFIENSASIMIPDLFCNIQAEKIDENDQFSCLKQLKYVDVVSIVQKCINFATRKNKIIILFGFSIGAALGLKVMEQFPQIALSLFFYGFPLAKSLNPQKLKSPVVIFHANKSNIKYLSQQGQLKNIIQAYSNRPHLHIEKINASHGFMNYQHEHYDQKAFKHCQKIYFSYLSEIKNTNILSKQEVNKGKNDKKQQQSGCSIF